MTMRSYDQAFLPSQERFHSHGEALREKPKAIRRGFEAAGLGLALLGLGLGAWFLWHFGGLFALGLAGLAWWLSWRSSPGSALPPGARPLSYASAPFLHDISIDLSLRAGLTRAPALFLLESPLPNAAALGRPSDPRILVTRGLLEGLGPEEMRAVLAHEMAHLAHGDLLWLSALSASAAFVSALGNAAFLMALIFLPFAKVSSGAFLAAMAAPLVAILISRLLAAFSREREFAADREAARLCGDGGAGLARALSLIEGRPLDPWALLARRILGMGGPAGRRSGPFDSHPPLEERLRRLGTGDYAAFS